MKHRSLLLPSAVMIAILIALGGAMIAIAHPVKSASTPAVVATCDQHLDTDTSSNLEPVSCATCAGGCPVPVGTCGYDGQVCNCPRGPGHCVLGGPPRCESVKCVKDP